MKLFHRFCVFFVYQTFLFVLRIVLMRTDFFLEAANFLRKLELKNFVMHYTEVVLELWLKPLKIPAK